MNRKGKLLCLLILAALLLSGCAVRTIDELYTPPRRSEEFDHLQSSIDIAMAGLEYAAPLSGENQQAVQMADLDGDGMEEYLVFAKGTSEQPMQILIFAQKQHDRAEITEVITGNGFAFDQVQYVEIDGKPGYELVVGRQVSNQLMRSVNVYSFATGRAELLMSGGYSRLLTCDLGSSDQNELLLIQRGESDQANAVAVLYRYRSKTMVRSVEVELSRPALDVKRVTAGRLQCGTPAVYVSSATEEDAMRTDILALRNERLVKVPVYSTAEQDVQALRNYDVYAHDVDNDGIVELPSLEGVRPVITEWNLEEQYRIRWYSVDLKGMTAEKLVTFHNYSDGWYLEMDSAWADRISMHQIGNTYAFYLWDANFREAKSIFTIFALSGSDRQTQASMDGRFQLHEREGVIYAAKLEEALENMGITEEYLINSFHLIHQAWNTGET